MAKWGEGDPRWIVEERPDAVNVNNWHWTEKNATNWSKNKFNEIFQDFNMSNSCGSCKITTIDKCEGEATANNRKGKIIVFYEWELKFSWKGKAQGKSEAVDVNGVIEIPNLSDENTLDDIDVQITCDTKTDEGFLMKEALIREATSKIKEQLKNYTISLREEFTKGMVLPKKDLSVDANLSNLSIGSGGSSSEKKVVTKENKTSVNPTSNVGLKLEVCDIVSRASMKCRAHEIYNVLTTPELFMAFTNGSGKLENKIGGTFEMFGGNVSGKFIEMDEPKRIVQNWRFKTWPDGYHSNVTFTFTEKEDSTEIKVVQKGVPRNDKEKAEEGWEKYYWDSIKKKFGFGSFIL